MIFEEKRLSVEPCTEAGWRAYDYLLSEVLNEQDILSMRSLGNLVYLRTMRKPFFKVDADYYYIKGIQGERLMRIAFHGVHEEEVILRLETAIFRI